MGKAMQAVGLSLEKFVEAKASKYNKKKVIEKQREDKLRRRSKLKRLKLKLESEGKIAHAAGDVIDNGTYVLGCI